MANKKSVTDEEAYLREHLNNIDNSGKQSQDIPFIEQPKIDNTKTSDLSYFSCDINELPCGQFYPAGTLFQVRAAKVIEIQAYSMVDDTNFADMIDKMNDILRSCVRIKYADGTIASYLDIKDPDRYYLIFVIRELTFQHGNSLTVTKKCTCGEELKIELKRENFVFYDPDQKLEQYFSSSRKTYIFTITSGEEFELCVPNIGLQKSFTEYIIKESSEKRQPNLSFLKIIPFMLPGRTSISYEGIKSKLLEFEQLNGDSFQFLNAAVGKMIFGIKELKRICACGEEVRTDFQFPNGASSIFVIPDAFDSYIKK